MEHHIRFDADAMTLYLLDQRALPGREDYLPIRTLDETIRALQVMVVRGAPAIGVTAGFGCVLALEELRRGLPAGADWRTAYDRALERLEAARPTAVNLRWGVERMRALWRAHAGLEMEALLPVLLAEAERSAATGRPASTTATPSSPTAMPGPWPRPGTARPWASSAAPWKRARRCGSSPTRRGPSCRGRA